MPLEVEGSLHLESGGGHELVLETYGDRLRLRAPGWRALRAVAAALPGRAASRTMRHRLHEALCGTGLQIDVMLSRWVVASIGPDVRPTLLARTLGLAPLAIHPWAALASLFDGQR